MTEHRRRKSALVQEWWRNQGSYTALHRGMAIALACEWEASKIAQQLSFQDERPAIRLKPEQIQTCEQRAISQRRAARFGPSSLTAGREVQWHEQMATVKACLYADLDTADLPDVGWTDEGGRAALREAQARAGSA